MEEKVKNILYEISASYQSNSLAFYDYEEFGVVFEVQTVRGNKEFIKLHYPCDKLACNMSCPEEIKILKSLDRYYKKRLNSYRYILEWKEANGVWLHTIPWQPITLDEFLVDRKNEIHQNDRYIKNIIAQVIQEAAVLERAGWVHNAIKFQNLLLSRS
ncbi:hypothetical protein [Endozoicomonas sp. Mp262]|uniref:hypothetical protein n=1 Tax=Endozoicomonas sp. Mp262 TaxID=2919499 RepID=UPI0021D7FC98